MIKGLGVLLVLIPAVAPVLAGVPEKPATWGNTSCGELAGSDAVLLEQVVRRVEERLVAATRDASLADAGQQRYLESVATATAEDLIGIISALHALSHLPGELEPSSAELYGLVGDLFLITDRPRRAMEAYRRADVAAPDEAAPGKAARCAAIYDGKIYTFEIVHSIGPRSRSRMLTPYVLSRDPRTGQVQERFLLPSVPDDFSIGQDDLHISYYRRPFRKEPRSIHLARQRLDYHVWVPDDLSSRSRLSNGSLSLAHNLNTGDDGEPSPELAPRRNTMEYLPADLDALEVTLRQAARRDPTQPWHLFILGQCLWTQGRLSEAIAAWEDLLAGEFQAIPYHEYFKMAWYFELYRQPEWADAAFRRALAQRRDIPLPVTSSTPWEREVNVSTRRLLEYDQWPELDAERAYLWWLRLRQISGVSIGDDFRAVLWANYFKKIGEAERSAAELAYRDRVRQSWPRPPLIAYLDYAIWFLAAAAWLLVAYIVLSLRFSWRFIRWFFKSGIIRALAFSAASLLAGGILLFSLPSYSTSWVFSALLLVSLMILNFFNFLPLLLPPNLSEARWRQKLAAGLHRCGVGLIPILVFGVSLAALSFTIFYFVRLPGTSLDLSDVLERRPLDTESADQEQLFGAALASHGSGDFQRARQLYESLPATPQVRQNLSALARGRPPLVSELVPYVPRVDHSALFREWMREESWQPWRLPYKLNAELHEQIAALTRAASAPAKYFFATNAYAEIALLAGPTALLLALFLRPLRRWLGRALLILIPGAAFLRRGQVVRAYLVFWLFFFSAGPLCWLFLAKTSNPDFVDAFGPHPSPGLFSSHIGRFYSISEDDFALPPPRYRQLLADNFWALLWVYPGAERFYFLVALSLSLALCLHGLQLPATQASPLRGGLAQGAHALSTAPLLPVKIGRRILPYDRLILPYGRRRLPCVN